MDSLEGPAQMATNDPLYGDQEGKFFHGYYGGYCYLPLYVFCSQHLLGKPAKAYILFVQG